MILHELMTEAYVTILQIPNGFGCGLGTVQLILYAIYRKNKGDDKNAATTDESMEMGLGKPHHDNQKSNT